MSNQLAVPFKKTYVINIKEAVRSYLQDHTNVHPDAFKRDVSLWSTLRTDTLGEVVHIDRIPSMLRYHAHLVFILTKLPTDIGLDIAYATVFAPSTLPVTLTNLAYERAAVLFNLAALYSQLAASEDRSNHDGIKRSIGSYQNAAGTLSYLIASALPKLAFSPDDEQVPLDLSEPFLKSLEWLMLAQAQECAWQKAKMDNFKNGLIARLAAKTASFYRSSVTTIRDASPSIKHIFPSNWLPYLETKWHHFEAVAQFRKSMDEFEMNMYGLELARLEQAQRESKNAYDIGRRGSVPAAVLQDAKSLLDAVQRSFMRAERDNDLIYHQDVPTVSALPLIQGAELATVTVPPGLLDLESLVRNDGVIFGDLPGWGAQEAINIYNHDKEALLKEKIVEAARDLEDRLQQTKRSLNLPAALEALEQPVGLPPSLLKKAEEVRLENGPAKIETSIKSVQMLALRDRDLLEEALDILDSEASEDEAIREKHNGSIDDRIPSVEANRELIEKASRYRGILDEAAASDEIVRQQWDQWEENIAELVWDEARLAASVPSSTVSPSGRSTSNDTRTHARALWSLLESLDDVSRARDQLVKRARRLADADDIHPRIMKAASGLERWTEAKPVMFADVSDSELGKYDKFIEGIRESEQKQNDLISHLQSHNEMFLQSRRDDPTIKDRENALQSLDLAYHKYREITRHLDEGLQFYNGLAKILTDFKESCKNWSVERKRDIHSSLSEPFQSLTVNDSDDESNSVGGAFDFPESPPKAVSSRKENKSSSGIDSKLSLNDPRWGWDSDPQHVLPPPPPRRK